MPIITNQDTGELFSRDSLQQAIDAQLKSIPSAVDEIDSNELLIIPVEDLVDIVDAHYKINVPTLLLDQMRMEEPACGPSFVFFAKPRSMVGSMAIMRRFLERFGARSLPR